MIATINLKNYFAWVVIYLGIGAVASLLLPFKYAMGVMLIVIVWVILLEPKYV